MSLGLLAQALSSMLYVRVTFYTLVGPMASGTYTHLGAAACSSWIPFGTELSFSDGMVVTCLDRGLGGKYWSSWVDVWAPSYLWGRVNVTEKYGDWTWVTVGSYLEDGSSEP